MQQLTPWIQSRFYYKNSTLPLSMGFLTFYYTGSTNKAPTFQEKNGVVNPNPVPLDIVGEAQIWLSESIVYDVEIRDANNALQDTRLGVSASSEGGGGGGLDFVTTANSDAITLDGLGTQPNPLTATLNISSVTSNALGITTAGGGGVYVSDMSEAISDKLDKVDATAQSVESEVEFKNGVEVSGALTNGSAITMPDNSWIRPSTPQGGFYLTNGIDPNTLNSTIHFLNSGLSLFSGDGVNQFGSMLMGNTQLYLSHSVANVAKDSLILRNEELSLQTTTGRGLYVTSTDLELSNTTSNISFNTSGLRFNGFNGGYEFLNVPTDTLAYTYGTNASGNLAKSLGGGGGSQSLEDVCLIDSVTSTGATFGSKVLARGGNSSGNYYDTFVAVPTLTANSDSGLRWGSYTSNQSRIVNGSRYQGGGQYKAGSDKSSGIFLNQTTMEFWSNDNLTVGVNFNPTNIFSVFKDKVVAYKELEGAQADFTGLVYARNRLLQGSVTDDGTTGIQCESLRSVGGVEVELGATFGDDVSVLGYGFFGSDTVKGRVVITSPFADSNLQILGKGIRSNWSFGSLPSSNDYSFIRYNPSNGAYIGEVFNITSSSGDFNLFSKLNTTSRILQGSVTDDGTTGIQCESLRSVGGVEVELGATNPSSIGRTSSTYPSLYVRQGGIGNIQWWIKDEGNGVDNDWVAKLLNDGSFLTKGTLTADIPTGTQVGLVGYDSNGKLIQGVSGGGGVTPTAWVNASLNSSLGFRSSMRPLRYRGDGIDGVQIEGSCKYNTGLALFPGFSVVLFTLPIGSRPNKDVNFTVQVGYNGSVPQIEAWASLNSSNGQVTLKNSDSVAISELYDITINTRFSLI